MVGIGLLILRRIVFIPRFNVDGPVVVWVTLFRPFGGRLHEAEVDGHRILVCGGDTCATVTQAKATQALSQAAGERPPAAFADDGLVGPMDLEIQTSSRMVSHRWQSWSGWPLHNFGLCTDYAHPGPTCPSQIPTPWSPPVCTSVVPPKSLQKLQSVQNATAQTRLDLCMVTSFARATLSANLLPAQLRCWLSLLKSRMAWDQAV